MSSQTSRPDWLVIQNQFREYIAAYQAGDLKPDCRDRLFSSIYHAVEYLSIVRYRQYAGHGTMQTALALDGVQNLFWKIDRENSPEPGFDRPAGQPADADQGELRRAKRQRTFTSLVTEEYRDEAPLGNFLSKVVGNALRDWFREQNRNRKLNLQLNDDMFKEIFEIGISDIPATSMHLAWGVGSHPPSPEEQTEINELKKIIATLCERDQQLIDLYYFQQMTTAEISELTGVNQSTLRTQISRALQAVRDVLSKQ
jgi:RNA polymerase sigma factor (sigma-70 family)